MFGISQWNERLCGREDDGLRLICQSLGGNTTTGNRQRSPRPSRVCLLNGSPNVDHARMALASGRGHRFPWELDGPLRERLERLYCRAMIVVVVGAGINGLVAAHYLRRAGHTVTVLERADRAGGACVRATATVDGLTQSYALGASSVLGLMPDFIFRETGLADRLDTYVPSSAEESLLPDRRRQRLDLPRPCPARAGIQGEVGRDRRCGRVPSGRGPSGGLPPAGLPRRSPA